MEEDTCRGVSEECQSENVSAQEEQKREGRRREKETVQKEVKPVVSQIQSMHPHAVEQLPFLLHHQSVQQHGQEEGQGDGVQSHSHHIHHLIYQGPVLPVEWHVHIASHEYFFARDGAEVGTVEFFQERKETLSDTEIAEAVLPGLEGVDESDAVVLVVGGQAPVIDPHRHVQGGAGDGVKFNEPVGENRVDLLIALHDRLISSRENIQQRGVYTLLPLEYRGQLPFFCAVECQYSPQQGFGLHSRICLIVVPF